MPHQHFQRFDFCQYTFRKHKDFFHSFDKIENFVGKEKMLVPTLLKVGILWSTINSLPNDRIFDTSKFEAVADDKK